MHRYHLWSPNAEPPLMLCKNEGFFLFISLLKPLFTSCHASRSRFVLSFFFFIFYIRYETKDTVMRTVIIYEDFDNHIHSRKIRK